MLKCAAMIDYFVANSKDFAEQEELKVANHKGYTVNHAVGPVLDIVPWNFPFWMPFKSMIPPLVLGNPILMKHAPSTPLCAEALDKLFKEAGFVDGEYENLFVTNEEAGKVLADKRVRGVKFTGSTRGG